MKKKYYFVYIATNKTNTVLYTGVTNNLLKRIWEHKNKVASTFSSRYNINKLVYYELFNQVNDAISREKQIKAGSRIKKLNLLRKSNPDFRDLYKDLAK